MNLTRDPKGYYIALGIDDGADADAIKSAYRKKAKRLHPDFNPSPIAAKQFHRLHEAYETLSDPLKRAAYDRPWRDEQARAGGAGAYARRADARRETDGEKPAERAQEPHRPKTGTKSSMSATSEQPATVTSALVYRAIIDRMVDLPTPEPAKMPMRCPWQIVVKELRARTPRSSLPPMRVRGWRWSLYEIRCRASTQRAAAVNRLAHAADDAPKPRIIGVDCRSGLGDFRATAETNPLQRTEGHDQCTAVAEPNHFAGNDAAVARNDIAAVAHRQIILNAGDFHKEALHGGDLAVDLMGRQAFQLAQQRRDIDHELLPTRGMTRPKHSAGLASQPKLPAKPLVENPFLNASALTRRKTWDAGAGPSPSPESGRACDSAGFIRIP